MRRTVAKIQEAIIALILLRYWFDAISWLLLWMICISENFELYVSWKYERNTRKRRGKIDSWYVKHKYWIQFLPCSLNSFGLSLLIIILNSQIRSRAKTLSVDMFKNSGILLLKVWRIYLSIFTRLILRNCLWKCLLCSVIMIESCMHEI